MRKAVWISRTTAMLAAMATPFAFAQSRPPMQPEMWTGPDTATIAAPPTRVLDAAAMQRLRRSTGMTLQWLSWDYRGPVRATMRGRTLWLEGRQLARGGGSGAVTLSGWVREVGARHFILMGTVTITDTPDVGRNCVRNGEMRFQVTQNRRYWRMQRMSECDGLTDYVDVYF